MADLEDGEISSDQESEMRDVAAERVQMSSFQSRGSSLGGAPITEYRNLKNMESSDSNSDSEDEAILWKRKRLKCSSIPAPLQAKPNARTATNPFARKVNNIWGSVVQEQSQEAVAAELGIMGMEGAVSMSSRQSETYNYVFARKMMAKERDEEEEGLKSTLDCELEGYMQQGGQDQKDSSHLKRKRPAKERLGPRAEMDLKGRYEIKEDDPEERVIDEIAHRLMEPKKDLIERVVRVIGNKKAIELLSETATIEQSGGLYTVDGSRRRTPGGVYLNLLKNTPSISHGQVKEIFHEENQKECNSKKAAKKRRRQIVAKKMKQAIGTLNLQEQDDISRETFASDTEEALVSLEEAPEAPSEHALGTEDNPVVYNSNDLEVF
ncbi:phosphorylated adapter RNA export protein [Danio rerio]|uniref:Phosphorylated adapter RNA export protein n=1 Tax=Danio rerio TaxID=7955 RepID=Q68EH5_DANRE|nr:phosphorylated adapter RNA export protein [Danio rerio]AAH80257.1 Phosphorylated adaptor for RNA export [Danio rerio]|eukprot:NP_001003995.1 phosphorylated adapter RNA export protein [Danio rerio]